MARQRRKSSRTDRDGNLEFGLADSDRLVGHPQQGRRTSSRRSRGAATRRRADRQLGMLGRLRRRIVRTCVRLLLVAIVGVVGIVGYYATKLPPVSEWEVPTRPATVRVVAAGGELITTRGEKSGEALTLDEMPSYLPQAVIAIEDQRFYWHFGIDPIGLTRAAFINWRAGGVVQGGSTITQQLAKNLFLRPERTIGRKIQEVILAIWLEASLSKRRILELYLNRVYLGGGAYGVDAAALRYFGKSAKSVTLAEAAILAGLLKAPGRYAPTVNPAAAEARATLVLAAMHGQGYIDGRQATFAMSDTVRPVGDIAGGSGRYVADWVIDLLPGYVSKLDRDVIVETTIDLKLQTAAANALTDTLAEEGSKFGVSQGALVTLAPDGAVKALVGGRDYRKSPFNRAVDARRQPGSAFKPFVYLAALEHGLIPETVRIDQPVSIRGWQPKNYTNEYRGPVTLQTALAHSLNTVSAQLTAEIGPHKVAATARRLGIASPIVETPSIALGTSEVSLVELTGAYVPFANGGNGVIPYVIKRIATAGGEVLYQRSGSGPGRVVDPRHVGMMNAMLRQTLEVGTGRRAAIADWPAAGKTGTSQGFRDAWFVGYTGALVAGVWMGNDDGKPTKKVTGGSLPALTWHRFMDHALDGVPVANLPGNYRFRDPSVVAGGATPSTPVGGIDELLSSPAAAVEASAPTPPADIGEYGSQRQERGGVLRWLFGR